MAKNASERERRETTPYTRVKRLIKKITVKAVGTVPVSSNVIFPIVPIFQDLPFKCGEGFGEYAIAGYDDRRKILEKMAVQLPRWNDLQNFRNQHRRVEDMIRSDPELRGMWCLSPTSDLGIAFRVQGQRAMISQGRANEIDINNGPQYPVPSDIMDSAQNYDAPRARILITPNLTFNELDVIPVYSDIPGESLENLEIPSSLLFDYTDSNMLNHMSEPILEEAVKYAEDPRNVIRCDCCSTDAITNCFENEDCPCYQMNEKMGTLQKGYVRSDLSPTKFSTFKPNLLKASKDHFYSGVAFACSESCGCRAKCTNNPLLIPQKKLIPLELYRTDKDLGFCLRSPVIIPAGTPVMEFTGQIVKSERLQPDNVDYAFQISYKHDYPWKEFLKEKTPFLENYKEMLVNLTKEEYFIDPKVYGNVARTAAHSCCSNIEMLRVFQKSLSPAHVHLVLVSTIDIFPGTPLTIDYGKEYVEKNFCGGCKCKDIGCKAGKNYELFRKMNYSDLAHCFVAIRNAQYRKWYTQIYEANRKRADTKFNGEIIEVD